MEPPVSHETVHRSSNISDVITSKRTKFYKKHEDDDFQLHYRSKRDVDGNLLENVASTTVFKAYDHVNDDSISDLKTECVSVNEVFMSVNDGFSRDSDTTITANRKRRRLDQQYEDDEFQLQYRSKRDVDVNLLENVASTTVFSASNYVNDDSFSDLKLQYCSKRDVDVNLLENVASVSASSDHVSSLFICSVNDDSFSDLKAECVSVTELFSRDLSESSVICLETEEIESESTSKPNNNNNINNKNNINTTSLTEEEMPTAEEIEDFFSKAEKYEQERFTQKYNYDIVKDVPMEGRYQWIQLNP